jgi:hypothetical protein
MDRFEFGLGNKGWDKAKPLTSSAPIYQTKAMMSTACKTIERARRG